MVIIQILIIILVIFILPQILAYSITAAYYIARNQYRPNSHVVVEVQHSVPTEHARMLADEMLTLWKSYQRGDK